MGTPQASDELLRPTTSTRSPWLFFLRALWLFVALVVVAILIAGFPVYYHQLRTVDACMQCGAQRLTEGKLDQLQALNIPVGVYAGYFAGLDVLPTAVYILMASVIFWRQSKERLALFGAFMLLTWGTAFSNIPPTLAGVHPIWYIPVQTIQTAGGFSFLAFFCLFPSGRFIPRWTRWLAAAWAVESLYFVFGPRSAVNITLWFGFLCTVAGVQIYRYRRVSNLTERQQTRWVVFGLGVAILGALGSVLIGAVFGVLQRQELFSGAAIVTMISVSILMIPLSIGMAIQRARLWDIDILINRTLVYGALTVTLALLYFGSVVLLQQVFRPLFGPENDLAIVGSTLAIAAIFQPLRRRIQTTIDRRFYRRKYDAVKTLQGFSARLRDEVDLSMLSTNLVQVVDETLQPQHISLWLKTPH